MECYLLMSQVMGESKRAYITIEKVACGGNLIIVVVQLKLLHLAQLKLVLWERAIEHL